MSLFSDLADKVKIYNPQADTYLLQKAFDFAASAHAEHKRLSGDPYIVHPVAVASILAGLEQDVVTLSAALLHDVIEDAEVDREALAKNFGEEIAKLVEGVTKLSQFTFVSREVRQAENFRKMFVAMGQDYRIIIIKLADRLHNMQTLKYLLPEKQKETALETREIFAPLAHRIGVWKVKWELEDLSFVALEPEKYEEIKSKVSTSRREREEYIFGFIEQVSKILERVAIKTEINGRPKHFYSIYRKMVDQNLEFDEIYDLTAVRVIVDSVKDCYAVLGLIHAAWKPIPGRFRDYIAMPKSNGYQSLHTTVIGQGGRPVEVQIRTREMHRIAEYGIAAHWRYKEGTTDKTLDQKMSWFREMLEWQNELKDAQDFMESLKIGLIIDEIFVFTPKGDVFDLPLGACPIDFAYRVHTEIGHRTVGAKVNGRIMPLDHALQSGDIVEIMTGKKDDPSRDWMRFCKTASARVKIRNWLKKHGEIAQVEAKIPEPIIEAQKDKAIVPAKRKPKSKAAVIVAGLKNVLIKFSRCCSPVPGDPVIGFVTKGKGVSVHRQDCKNAIEHKPLQEKVIKVEWDLLHEVSMPVEIEIEAFDRVGVFKDILAEIAETHTNVASAKISTKRGSTAFLKVKVDVKNLEHLYQVIKVIKNVRDVYSVKR
ncbi:MAG: bifunctional (p)ppGpp synthetase/guanosine-3',5'-bis(diphosphate) 3'-pyrophosphohydrolase [Candidatus Margulisbacteria bacterium]|nr:bifunctional (p)ppGpp synthetase/guanosine-3',5'-bis(diphosphate) 3'-pyrophosphohydrolase [Candidatus Margulisiibacteriota bacterium]